MKTMLKRLMLAVMAVVLLISQAAAAEQNEIVKGVFDALLAEGSDYQKSKASYAEWYPEIKFQETLADDGFTLAISGSEYMDGSWTFTLDGDYFTLSIQADDFNGFGMATIVLQAVGEYYGMNTSLLNGYIAGLGNMGLENKYFIMEDDEAAGTRTMKIYAAGVYDMAELDQMVINENALPFGPLTADYNSMSANSGKNVIVVNGNMNYATILLGEYGGLDDLAYQSIMNAMIILQPRGWEDFAANCTELKDAETDQYTVTVNAQEEAVREIIDDPREGYQWAIIRIGDESLQMDGFAMEGDADEDGFMIDEIFNGTEWECGDLHLNIDWLDGYYQAVVMENGEEKWVYLCEYGDYIDEAAEAMFSSLTGIGTGDEELTESQEDHGQATFYYNFMTDEMVWQKADGTDVIFTQAVEQN